ncbi:acyl-CoA thioesterase/BAAT N-terminal domain-containing protein [Actinomycetospora endophytica]|uniref:Acyl-CoA thioesterase/BAAT N-terminal domain-containing protein n=1 Tax=Actinomycetospora endophytica TaxID=2291215 RepID=A0ABS8PA02_9PSEU|nr:acyl-CoA thioester hydrolase/BAAT C-terminal domain-containing protein [Actinomycetospora endophytica]MCD2195098.1 acyl-CoA thioesterase/BAAT N-terminal domain-containing protein [Actinomycetospora endophytica]
MTVVLGFVPWIVYWVLVGNAPFTVAVLAAFAVAVLGTVVSAVRGTRPTAFDLGNVGVFVVLALAAFVVPDPVLERWLQPLGNAGLLVVALAGVLAGHPFVRDYATASVDAATARSDGFRVVTTAMTWLWVGVFAAMTLISAIPPVLDGAATIRDAGDTLSVVCYWVAPFLLLGLAGAVSAAFPPWFERASAKLDARPTADPPPTSQPVPPTPAAVGLVVEAPPDSRHDEPFGLVVRGAPAGARVRVTSEGTDLAGRTWRATADLVAGSDGALDAATTAPVAGDWATADPDAALWAMRFAETGAVPDLFVPPAEPWQVTVRAAVAGGASGGVVVRRRPVDPGVHAEPCPVQGRPGLLAVPAGPPPPGGWPGVVCLGGSEGGHESQIGPALLLASHGFAALAASWVEPGPGGDVAVTEVPLERFAAAATALAGHDDVDADRVAAMGISRGAEGLLAACAGAGMPPLCGLVLISPSSVTWQAVGDDGEVPDTGSWTLGGRSVPWRPLPAGALMPQIVRNAWRLGADERAHRPSLLRLRPAYRAGLAADGPGEIAAERIAAPLLLISGDDDAVWPGSPMADALLRRRARPDDEHVAHPGAGHLTRLGTVPTDAPWTGGIALGGERADQAAADRDATARVLRFLAPVTPAVDPHRPMSSR